MSSTESNYNPINLPIYRSTALVAVNNIGIPVSPAENLSKFPSSVLSFNSLTRFNLEKTSLRKNRETNARKNVIKIRLMNF